MPTAGFERARAPWLREAVSVTARATGETLERVEGIEARAVSEPAEEPAAPAPASAAATPGTATPGTATIAAPRPTLAAPTCNHRNTAKPCAGRRRSPRGEPSAPLVPDPKAVKLISLMISSNPPSRTTESAALTAADRTANQR
ncbi:MAG: hypothetical protein KDB71_14910 [Mycobacterium sp.]|nr:hypothetical protein [Mycobacterium sp.]